MYKCLGSLLASFPLKPHGRPAGSYVSFDKKKQEKSPGSATITNRSPSQPQEEEETDKSKQAQTEQTYEKH